VSPCGLGERISVATSAVRPSASETTAESYGSVLQSPAAFSREIFGPGNVRTRTMQPVAIATREPAAASALGEHDGDDLHPRKPPFCRTS
jgi:hypothetical protein